MQRFDLRKLGGAEIKTQYQVKIANRFALWKSRVIMCALIGLAKVLEIGRISEMETMSLRVKATWLRIDEECSELLGGKQQAKLQRLQERGQMETFRILQDLTKKRKHLNDQIN
jgi:hypothetical protein